MGGRRAPRTPAQGSDAFEADKEIEGYQWWLAREEGKGWQLITWGTEAV